jgi:hypothetical protein
MYDDDDSGRSFGSYTLLIDDKAHQKFDNMRRATNN